MRMKGGGRCLRPPFCFMLSDLNYGLRWLKKGKLRQVVEDDHDGLDDYCADKGNLVDAFFDLLVDVTCGRMMDSMSRKKGSFRRRGWGTATGS